MSKRKYGQHEEYYNKKLQLMERDVIIKEWISTAIETYANLLQTKRI